MGTMYKDSSDVSTASKTSPFLVGALTFEYFVVSHSERILNH